MNATFKLLLVVLGTSFFAALPSRAQIKSTYHSGRLIVKLKSGVSAQAVSSLQNKLQANVVKRFPRIGAELWQIKNTSVEQALKNYRNDPRVEYIEPDYTITLDQTLSRDPDFSRLWGLHNTGQTGGTPDADIDAPEAWEIQTGGNVIVGVIDTGVDYNHKDLAANIWTNPFEIPNNGVDDDGNGYVDDVHGWDFANDDGDPFDDHRHGTHVAGTIAAIGNNGIGVAGASWSAKIMALKFLDDTGEGFTSDAVEAILYASAMGAQVTNNSWGGSEFSQALRDAIAFAGTKGQLFIAAAGNDSTDTDVTPHYPASYDLDNIIAVAATDYNDNLAGFSNRGAVSVDLGAPGVDILSTLPSNGYGALSGTSMATPHVSGVVSLLWSTLPGMPANEVKRRILTFVDRSASLTGKTVTGGRLNAHKALLAPDLYQLVASVDTIWTNGNAGPLVPLVDAGFAIAAGNELTASFPSLVTVATRIGPGRVVAFGHEGFFGNNDITKFDNLRIATNAFEWLDHRQRKKIVFTTGHDEWAGQDLTLLHERLRQIGYTVILHAGSVDENLLSDAGVVFIGIAWRSFTDAEIDALRDFLQQGGGLLLQGLGWSWLQYHPGTTLDDYPMNKIGAIAGVRWLDGIIRDSEHQYQGMPLFLTFYPNIQIRMVRVENVRTSPGKNVIVPIKQAAKGDEQSLNCSITFDPTLLKDARASLGKGASAASLEADTSQIRSGHLGLRLNLPAGSRLAPGTHEIIVLSFFVDENAPTDSTTRIEFGDQPIATAMADANGQALPATWTGGTIAIESVGGCVVTILQAQMVKQNLTTDVAPAPDRLRGFRDRFMRSYKEGNEYIEMYYAFSKHFKTNPSSLLKSAAALPHLYKAINALEKASGNEIIITPELQRTMMAIIEDYRNVEDREFQKILARLENDLKSYQGLPKNKLLARMTLVKSEPAAAEAAPEAVVLHQNEPNPFNPTTTIRYTLHQPARVTLKIYNLLGEEVIALVDEHQQAGQKAVVWNSRNRNGQPVPSGVYFYRMTVTGAASPSGQTRVLTRKMLLMK
jgi:subtilisin family serine protease